MTITASLLILVWSAALWDLNQRRIPNALVFGGIVVGSILQLLFIGHSGFVDALSGLFLGLVLLMPGYLLGFTGAADVKLMGAAGTFLGPAQVFFAALASLLVGGLIALGFMVAVFFMQGSQAPWQRYGLMFRTFFSTGRPVYVTPEKGEVMGRRFPFAVSIAIGSTLLLFFNLQT